MGHIVSNLRWKTSHSKFGLNNTRCWSDLRWFLVLMTVYMKLYDYMYGTCITDTNIHIHMYCIYFTVWCESYSAMNNVNFSGEYLNFFWKIFKRKLRFVSELKENEKTPFVSFIFSREKRFFIPAQLAVVNTLFNTRPISIFVFAVWACILIGTG